MTALAQALREAGIVPPDERLMQIAIEAWGKWPRADAGGARRDFVTGKLTGEMTWSMIYGFQPAILTQAVGWLLNRAKEAIEDQRPERDAGKPAGAGHIVLGTQDEVARANPPGVKPADQKAIAPVVTPFTNADASRLRPPATVDSEPMCPSPEDASYPDAGASRLSPPANSGSEPMAISPEDTLSRDAGEIRRGSPANEFSEPKVSSPGAATIAADQRRARAAQALAVRLTRIDTFLPDGKPVADWIVADLRRWADGRLADARVAKRDAIFARNLCANLPGDTVIGEHWKVMPDEVEKIYANAERDAAKEGNSDAA